MRVPSGLNYLKLTLILPQVILNTDEISYGGNGELKDDQYLQRTSKKRCTTSTMSVLQVTNDIIFAYSNI